MFPVGTYIQLWDTMDPRPLPTRPGCLYCLVVIKNSGQTPARDVVHWGAITICEVAREDTLVPPAVLETHSPAAIGAGGDLTKGLWTAAVSAADIQAIEASTKAIYVYGKVVYRDVFRRRQETSYRLLYSGKFPPPPTVSLAFSVTGNSST